MTREGHLQLLRRSVDQWNQWRSQTPNLLVDLQGANLRGADLIGANLSGVILRRANLREANFTKADLSHAVLIDADCRGADFSGANCHAAQLIQADLRRTSFKTANLKGADLSRTNFSRADLNRANLTQANLNRANLTNTDLSHVRALGSDFTTATLTGACLEQWQIDSSTRLEMVTCDYVYLRGPGRGRYPSRDTLTPDNRARLFQQTLGRLELRFEQGINWQAFIQAFQQVNEQHDRTQLAIQGMDNLSHGGVVVRVSVSPDSDKLDVQRDWMKFYSEAYQIVMEHHHQLSNSPTESPPQTDVSDLFNLLLAATPRLDLKKESAVTVSTQATEVRMSPMLPGPDLANTATALQKLLTRMTQAYPITTEAKKQALIAKTMQQIERQPLLKAQLTSHLQQGEAEDLLKQIKHPLAARLLRELKHGQF